MLGMSNRKFLGTLLVTMTCFLILEKYRECFERGYTDCPMRGKSMRQPLIVKGVESQ